MLTAPIDFPNSDWCRIKSLTRWEKLESCCLKSNCKKEKNVLKNDSFEWPVTLSIKGISQFPGLLTSFALPLMNLGACSFSHSDSLPAAQIQTYLPGCPLMPRSFANLIGIQPRWSPEAPPSRPWGFSAGGKGKFWQTVKRSDMKCIRTDTFIAQTHFAGGPVVSAVCLSAVILT